MAKGRYVIQRMIISDSGMYFDSESYGICQVCREIVRLNHLSVKLKSSSPNKKVYYCEDCSKGDI